MLIDGGTYMFREGRAYEFDNTRFHGVINDGSEPRVHMICDVLNMDDAKYQVLARAEAGDGWGRSQAYSSPVSQ
jgi:aspartyl/asparaginyl beta-hydroxylase (cupin superfamily)